MKIGKITLDGYFNYGNVLQNYALNHILEIYADDVVTLWYTKEFSLPEYWVHQRPWNWKSYIKFIIDWKDFRHKIVTGFNDWEVYRNYLTGIEGRRGTEDNAYEISEPLLMKWSADMEDRLNNERKRSHEYLKSVLV